MTKRNKNSEDSLNVVGKPFRKVDARAKCVGQTKFADDIFLPRMLHCKILRSKLAQLASDINASGAPVTATVLNDGTSNYLSITAAGTGAMAALEAERWLAHQPEIVEAQQVPVLAGIDG